jgi:hypothetical protein
MEVFYEQEQLRPLADSLLAQLSAEREISPDRREECFDYLMCIVDSTRDRLKRGPASPRELEVGAGLALGASRNERALELARLGIAARPAASLALRLSALEIVALIKLGRCDEARGATDALRALPAETPFDRLIAASAAATAGSGGRVPARKRGSRKHRR